MDMPALRHTATVNGGVAQRIPLHHGDRFKKLGRCPRSHQARHAGAQNHPMLTELRHKPPPDVRHYGRVLRTAERVPDYSLFADVEGSTCLRPNEKPTTQSVSPV